MKKTACNYPILGTGVLSIPTVLPAMKHAYDNGDVPRGGETKANVILLASWFRNVKKTLTVASKSLWQMLKNALFIPKLYLYDPQPFRSDIVDTFSLMLAAKVNT